MASLLDDFWFYNRDISSGYKKYSAALESLRIEREIAALGLGRDPVAQYGGNLEQPAALGQNRKDGDGGQSSSQEQNRNTTASLFSAKDAVPALERQNTEQPRQGGVAPQEENSKPDQSNIDDRLHTLGIDPGSVRYDDKGIPWTAREIDARLIAQGVDPDSVRYHDDQGKARTERELANMSLDSGAWKTTKDVAGRVYKEFFRDGVAYAGPAKSQKTSTATSPTVSEEEERRRQEREAWMRMKGIATRLPGDGNVSSEFGPRPSEDDPNRIHKGIDIPNANGADVRASDSGTVIRTEPFPIRVNPKTRKEYGGESVVIIQHIDGSTSRYLHTAPTVKVGDYVIAGNVIGKTDKSGKTWNGYHIHYEYRTPDEKPVDPREHLPLKQKK
jgi:murein DD-endopeptidase MepM/ murein hydrolase activator NlpD